MLLLSAGWTLGGLEHRLLDLTAARFIVVDPAVDAPVRAIHPPRPALLFDGGELRVYENPSALPRARFVPRVAVVADERALLDRLAHGADDLQAVALVDAPPTSGFLGDAGPPGHASVGFVRDGAAHLVLGVDAPRRGFVLLADQDYPGWRATVNGEPAPILRANAVFRAVEVPAGASTIELRYRPPGLVLGAAVSAASVAAVVATLARRRPAPADVPARDRASAG